MLNDLIEKTEILSTSKAEKIEVTQDILQVMNDMTKL